MELITVTSSVGMSAAARQSLTRLPIIDGLFPEAKLTPRPYELDRPVIFLTARVHGAETPASIVMDAILDQILASHSRQKLNNDNAHQMRALLKSHIIALIPMLNPDGVALGHHKSDAYGLDLNHQFSLTASKIDRKRAP